MGPGQHPTPAMASKGLADLGSFPAYLAVAFDLQDPVEGEGMDTSEQGSPDDPQDDSLPQEPLLGTEVSPSSPPGDLDESREGRRSGEIGGWGRQEPDDDDDTPEPLGGWGRQEPDD